MLNGIAMPSTQLRYICFLKGCNRVYDTTLSIRNTNIFSELVRFACHAQSFDWSAVDVHMVSLLALYQYF